MLDLLGRQVASPVQFVRGLRTLYDAGARVFVEVGPKKALHGFVEDVLRRARRRARAVHQPPQERRRGLVQRGAVRPVGRRPRDVPAAHRPAAPTAVATAAPAVVASAPSTRPSDGNHHDHRDTHDHRHRTSSSATSSPASSSRACGSTAPMPRAGAADAGWPTPEPVVITGAALGLPGVRAGLRRREPRSGSSTASSSSTPSRTGSGSRWSTCTSPGWSSASPATRRFEAIDDEAEVVKLAGRHAPLDVVEQFGVDAARDAALDSVTRLAIGAGFDALRDAGMPLVMRYKTTTLGSQLPERWGLPDALRDDTGVIFASAFPGYDSFAEDLERYYTDRGRREQLLALEAVRSRMRGDEPRRRRGGPPHRRAARTCSTSSRSPSTGGSCSGACPWGTRSSPRSSAPAGPNTQINAACASTTQALSLAEDWIRAGRCRRVVVVVRRRRHQRRAAAVGHRGLPGLRRGGDRRLGRGRGDPVRPPPARHDRRDGRRRVRRRVRRGRARARPAADLRGARGGHREQRLPRHPPRRRPHRAR